MARSCLQLWYSDDLGEEWHASEQIGLCADPPRPEPYAAELPWETIVAESYGQEPGVEECADGSLYYYCRIGLGYMYQARSTDQGRSFTALEPRKEIISPIARTD